ncbi:MAG: sigma 54-interacting transcriptional regulator [bacterium]
MISVDHKLEHLIDLAYALSQQNHFEEILRLVAQRTAALLHGQTALIIMVNPQTRQTVKTVVREGREDEEPKYRAVQDQINGWIMKFNQPLLSQDIKSDPRFAKVKFSGLAVKSAIAVLLSIEGIMLGSIILLNKQNDEAFNENDLAYLDKIAIIAAPYLRNVQKIQQFFAAPIPEASLLSKYEKLGLLGRSKKFVQLLQTIEAAARCDVRVLLEGESGTGKERIAKAIHKFSHRSSQPFVAIDCGAIPAHLIESELFGFLKGAFTGAMADRKGLLEEANHGTLFMDEIANLPMEVQSKFMRVLQEGEIRPLGSNKSRAIDVRIISASSRSLQKLVEAQQFREDLFYRLHVYPIYVPSLSDRRTDIALLANHFLKKFSQQQKKHATHLSESLLEFLHQRKWPGNIRELENFVERLVTLAPQETEIVDHDMLPPDLKKEFKKLKPVLDEPYATKSLEESLAEYEERLLRKALIEHDWNQSQAARALKIPVPTIRYKMSRLGIVKPE